MGRCGAAFQATAPILTLFGPTPARARARLRQWMEDIEEPSTPEASTGFDVEPEAPPASATDRAAAPALLPDDAPSLERLGDENERLALVNERVCRSLDVDPVRLRGRERGVLSDARRAISYLATRLEVPAARVARALGISQSGVSQASARGRQHASRYGRMLPDVLAPAGAPAPTEEQLKN